MTDPNVVLAGQAWDAINEHRVFHVYVLRKDAPTLGPGDRLRVISADTHQEIGVYVTDVSLQNPDMLVVSFVHAPAEPDTVFLKVRLPLPASLTAELLGAVAGEWPHTVTAIDGDYLTLTVEGPT